ncbi:hypothetical protein CcaverHIS002_0207780 [Cutaneotrichosporon cavernicola]|uniref:Catalase n=1 Tax=Cutaneotrichosporon cavernicola TaxID=279322 RepID=A0AA48I983_9TREE|nr:uncharacterized protein CcaverHIS019_0207770 [Cutaneotrichosporon cavernicola]BEI81618.1 hypothetical protein CcaverHIS002_0207780 [Cutaneotrichosporon cavernicola]BEI89415.1 hypothetical protein CcaverHIS019_0207770 [Cutaneotrichosporon cavernicola]BEI97189.1 hypothetical protein CcaverHIS631_0207780 [Cutaneotrichosporon cavernicola]BEJ04962.1 hypothetical protein CcaverHIS641_0207790 [Cutaneotrichosporon cavernicola]
MPNNAYKDLEDAYAADADLSSKNVVYTATNGAPIAHPYASQRAGSNGPLLLQDFHLIDLLSHFDRERIPERVVHAKGAGAHGEWECTEDFSDVCLADLFKKGTKCPVTIRFSTVGGESGSSDQARDPRGFAVKFRTAEGNWDYVGNNTPIFFLRDPAKFPHFIHTQKRDPATHLGGGDDSTLFWDYLSNNPESAHQVVYLFGDRGIPYGVRYMHTYYGHSLKLINKGGEWVYAQFHLKSDQGEKNQTDPEKALRESPDLMQKDLIEAINRKDYPSWTLSVQLMTPKQAEEAWEEKGINVFDLTHIWPHKDYPLRKIGKNYFAEVEQAAFSPSHMVPGIEPSEDPVLQSRLFSYPDTHRYRLGTNYQQLPVNLPRTSYPMGNFQRDGSMAFFNQGGRPNYLSTIDPIQYKDRKVNLDAVHAKFISNAIVFLSTVRPEDFNAPRALWEKVYNEEQRERLIKNMSQHMSTVRDKSIIERQIGIFRAVSEDLASRLEKATGVKGLETLKGVTFNGSHNGMGGEDVIPANNLPRKDEISFENGGPGETAHPKYT